MGVIEFPHFTTKWHSEPYPFIDPTRPELSSQGKNVVITGGGTGIGKAIGVAFAKAGASSVVILGRRLEVLQESQAAISAAALNAGVRVICKKVDLVQKDKTVRVLNEVAEEVGKIDVLVLNAGVYGQGGEAAELDAARLTQTFELNVCTVLNTFQAFLPHAAHDAVVLHSSTFLAHGSPIAGAGAYPVTKAAALKLMDYIATENPQLRVISAQPCWTPTDLNGYHPDAHDSVDLAGCFYVWLASSEAAFLNRKFVWSNWDAEEMLQRAESIRSSAVLTWALDGAHV